MKLYEITAEYRAALDALSTDDAGLESMAQRLADLEGAWEDKALAVACYIRECLAAARVSADEAERLNRQALQHSNAAERLRAYLLMQMRGVGKTKIERAGLPTIRVQPSPEHVRILDIGAVPDEYLRPAVSPGPDKDKIRRALKAGLDCNWAALESGEHVRIV